MKTLRITGGAGVHFTLPDDPELAKTMSRVLTNIIRVNSLVALYKGPADADKSQKGRSSIHRTDILRAAVVLLHATLEDGLRSLIRFRMPRTRDTLEAIALADINDSGRPEKFSLGALYRFRGKTVDQIFEESIEAHLSRQSFNDTTDVTRALKLCNVSTSEIEPLLSPLSDLIARRHHIVHNADINENKGKAGHQFARSIRSVQVQTWSSTIFALFTNILIDLTSERLKINKTENEPNK